MNDETDAGLPSAQYMAPESVEGRGLMGAVLPAVIGNILGTFFLVGLPFYLVSNRGRSDFPTQS